MFNLLSQLILPNKIKSYRTVYFGCNNGNTFKYARINGSRKITGKLVPEMDEGKTIMSVYQTIMKSTVIYRWEIRHVNKKMDSKFL